MSRWNPNFVPPNQSYHIYDDSLYTADQNLYTMINPYNDNGNRYYAPQFAQNYSQNIPMNFYSVPNVESEQFNGGNMNSDSTSRNQVNTVFVGPSSSTISGNNINTSFESARVKDSKLTPTAEEFRPRNYYNVDSGVNNGTVKKPQYHSKNKKQNQTGNEQWINGALSRQNCGKDAGDKYRENQNYYKQKRKGYVNFVNKSSEQNKVLEETASFLRTVNDTTKSKTKDEGDLQINNEKSDDVPKVKTSEKHGKNSHNWSNGKNGDYSNKKNGRNVYYKYDRKHEESVDKRDRDNWRYNSNTRSNNWEEKKNSHPQELKKKLDAASQRERLEQMVERRLLECLVCCEHLRHSDAIWSCKQCYHILHLNCVIRWAKTSKLETGWRCPACQNVYTTIPNEYRCYCDKTLQPRLELGTLPHSCGEVCGRKGRSCEHSCTLLCHPGPCPDCTILVPRSCGCGATRPTVKCSSDVPIVCQKVCGKTLECGIHKCSDNCHMDKCGTCKETLRQECFCGKVGRKIPCTAKDKGNTQYECGEICGKDLPCGNHRCEMLCHSGDCSPCPTSPSVVKTCPCGQTKITDERKSCLDVIACCDKICNKTLKCGQPSAPHQCGKSCHQGDCPPCLLTTLVRCRCGHMDKELACSELKTKADDARCQKKCTKLRLCCKHKCNQLCCIELEHVCPLPCNRMLSCGLHRCEETCHRALCPPCWRTSFQELFCECGSSVLYPPVACGTRPPPCNKPCSRQRRCGHEVYHNCHTGPCPPCTVMSKRWCHGHHEQRSTILCYQEDFSCGLPCGREMSCGRHKCIQPCHTGPCPSPCNQPCTNIRQSCEHTCNQPCHESPCPETSCRQTVRVTCQCGLRSSTRACMELVGEYQNIVMSHLASKMADIQKGQAVDITDLISGQKRQGTLKTLECNDDCRLLERNRRLAIGLQIRNPDLSAKLTPRYSDFMKSWAKKDLRFCQHVHEKLTELVQLAKQSKQKSRSFSFESMNKDKRHLVHEYCEHFGCESEAYDAEPNRNVVATAFRDKSWLPSIGLSEFLQRENGHRKVPGPILGKKKLLGRPARPPTPPGEYVDYFEDPPV